MAISLQVDEVFQSGTSLIAEIMDTHYVGELKNLVSYYL